MKFLLLQTGRNFSDETGSPESNIILAAFEEYKDYFNKVLHNL